VTRASLEGPAERAAPSGEAPDPPEIVVAWTPLPDDAVLAPKDSLGVEFTNTTDQTQRATAFLHVTGLDARQVTRKLTSVTLGAKQRRRLDVRVGALPIQSDQSDVGVVVEVDLARPEGPVRLATEPRYCRFDAGYARATVRPEAAPLAANEAPATDLTDIRGRLLTTEGRWLDAAVPANRDTIAPDGSGSGQGRSVLGFARLDEPESAPPALAVADATSAQAAAVSPQVAAARWITVSSTWHVYYIDAGRGTDFFNTTGYYQEKARYAKAKIYSTNPDSPIWSGYLDGQGNAPSLQLANGTYYLYQDTRTRQGNVDITGARYLNGSYVYTYIVTAFTVTSTSKAFVQLNPLAMSSDFEVAALAGQILWRKASSTDFGVPDGSYVIVANQDCPSQTGVSCGDYPTSYLCTTVLSGATCAHWRFIAAHEFAHATQRNTKTMLTFSYGDAADPANLCNCSHIAIASDHCLQSREQTEAAQAEGFAHAFATRVFNATNQSNGVFVYYKHFRETTGAITAPPKEREGYAPQLWLDTRCTKPLLSYRAVEWDWLTFFFNVTSASTSSPTPFQRLHAMYQRACAGGNLSDECDAWDGVQVGSDYFVGFEQLRSAAYDEYFSESGDPNDPRFVRFRNALEAHGVNH